MEIPLIVLTTAAAMICVESAAPGRRWPTVAGWCARAAALNGAQAGVVFLAGACWEPWLADHRLWSVEGLGHAGTLLGYLAITFIYYWWHRLRHESDFFWRWFHQVHHSPRRIEIITSFYKHPFEILANSVLSSAILYSLVGLAPAQAAAAILLTGLAELFYHWNVETPYWLGYFFQRPESHCLHHQEGVHSYNYGDLPLWDMLFGTFRNPRSWEARCGFGEKNEPRLPEMLAGVGVSKETRAGQAA